MTTPRRRALFVFLLAFTFAPVLTVAQDTKTETDVVYITKTGEKYHRSSCRTLRKSRIPIARDAAIKRGYTGCRVCRP